MAIGLILGAVAVLIVLYLLKVNNGMKYVPESAVHASPKRWSEFEIRETAARLSGRPIDFTSYLPPVQDRRYIIVGGSGVVGEKIAFHLLARGQKPQSVRIIDLREPSFENYHKSPGTYARFVVGDITSADSVNAAFEQPWPVDVASKPLTVFHTAAAIRPSERSSLLLPASENVNVHGTKHVLDAARKAGADIFVATASIAIDLRPAQFWISPSQNHPNDMFQLLGDADGHQPLRGHSDYFSNYAYTKARAEKIVLDSHGPGFRTGCLRLAAVYGDKRDLFLGFFLKQGQTQTWFPGMTISCAHVENVSLAHLLYEQALLTPDTRCGGKSFVITDSGPPVQYCDVFTLLQTLVPGVLLRVAGTLAHIAKHFAATATAGAIATASWLPLLQRSSSLRESRRLEELSGRRTGL